MHKSVMLNEVIKHLNIKSNGFYIDATFGAGGHSMEILKHLNFHGKITAFDKNIKLYKNIKEKKNINKFNATFDSLLKLSK
ncbi:MAG: 16S rRNA (cytosine(1402)-N(4))-methyltransferase [Candidatus Riesia sp.]|nr:16S rRNA (cytosine(1402)-N(4))-methyltransferase [Candidatus Riesia sp.]